MTSTILRAAEAGRCLTQTVRWTGHIYFHLGDDSAFRAVSSDEVLAVSGSVDPVEVAVDAANVPGEGEGALDASVT